MSLAAALVHGAVTLTLLGAWIVFTLTGHSQEALLALGMLPPYLLGAYGQAKLVEPRKPAKPKE